MIRDTVANRTSSNATGTHATGMNPLRIQFATADAPQTRLDQAIEWLLLAAIAFCLLTFGGVYAWSEGVFVLLASAIAVCFSVKLILRTDARFVWSWTYLPIALFILLVAFQLVPLPVGVMRAISPHTVDLKTRLLQGLPHADQRLRWMTLTFYPEVTARQLRLVLAIAALFVVVLNVFQTIDSIRRLLICICIIGLAEALLALAQDATQTGAIYWIVHIEGGHAFSGSFVNHSHFGQFMNLCIGASIGLMLLEWRRRMKQEVSDTPEAFYSPVIMWLAIAGVFACAIALMISLTRGGVISMLIAGVLTLVVLRIKAPSRSRIFTTASLVVAVIVLAVAWIGFENVYQRFASTARDNSSSWRGQTIRDLTAAWKQFPVFGTGLGTHPVIFPMFDRSEVLYVATHAEDEYAQLMTETGAIALFFAVGFALMIWICYARSLRGRFSSIAAVAIGLGYGFAAILIHSLSDFGQHIPADALLTAVTCGLLVSLARQRKQRRDSARLPEEFTGSAPLRIAGASLLAAACLVVVFQCYRVARAELEFRAARRIEDRLRRTDWSGNDDAFADMIIHAQNAHDIRPGNVDFAYWLPVYRWKWMSVQPDAEQLPRYQEFARRIADELNRARLSCPTFGLPATLAGQIELFVLRDNRGADDIRTGRELNRNDPTAVFVDGELAASQGDWERSLKTMKHYQDIVPGGVFEAVDLYVNTFNRPDLALSAAAGDAQALDHLADLLTPKQGDAGATAPQTTAETTAADTTAADTIAAETTAADTIAAAAKQQADDLRLQSADRPQAGAGEIAQAAKIAAARDDHAAAARYYKRELDLSFGDASVRFRLIQELAAAGNNPDAIDQLHIFLRQRPYDYDAKKLLKQLEQ